MKGALRQGQLKPLYFLQLRIHPWVGSGNAAKDVFSTSFKANRGFSNLEQSRGLLHKIHQLTRTRSDMFCPKTNFAPVSVLFVSFFELGKKAGLTKHK